MSITLKTLILDGVGREAKMIVADTEEDFLILRNILLFPEQVPPAYAMKTIETLKATLRKSLPIAEIQPPKEN